VAGVADLLTTYLGSPDLAKEANPVFHALGDRMGGRAKLIMIKVVGTVVGIACFHAGMAWIERRRDRIPPGTGFIALCGLLFFKEKVSVTRLLIGLPRDWGAVGALCCLTLAIALALGGFLGAASNALRIISSMTGVVVLWVVDGVASVMIALGLIHRFLFRGGRGAAE